MSEKKTTRILGMMSGTSLDGLDMALCEFGKSSGNWTFRILHTAFTPYGPGMRSRLQGAISLPAHQLLAFHEEYGNWLGVQASKMLRDAGVPVHAIASHGHTVHHRPEEGFTFQLGAPQQVALVTECATVGDVRSLDVALGGQGAPLVPVGDRLLFGQYRFCLNLGGISNLSFERDGRRIAFDIGVANMLLNHLCLPLGMDYDKNGALARRGVVAPHLLEALDSLPYYDKPFPKSIGYEWFRDAVLPVLAKFPDRPENQLRTAVEHIAGQIARQLRSLAGEEPCEVLVTGGGAFNGFLLEIMQQKAGPGRQLVVPGAELISFKEALVFAFLGALRLAGAPNVLASVTGARRDSCSGVVYYP